MRFLCYLSEEDEEDVRKILQLSDQYSALQAASLAQLPTENIVQFYENESFELDIDSSNDILLIDPSLYQTYSSISTYCIFSRKIPVFVMCENDDMINLVKKNLIQTSELFECGLKKDLQRFIKSFAKRGKLISFEGGDGVGKQTQTALMKTKLESLGYIVKTIDFPHDKAACGKLIRKVLRGDFGTIGEVNPVLFASLYGFNRADLKGLLDHWLRKGYIVILDRYVEANYGHQLSKIHNLDDKKSLLHSLNVFEHQWLGLPRSDVVLYLDLPPLIAQSALSSDKTRSSLDIHETAENGYKERVRQTFLWCSEVQSNWKVIPCLQTGNIEGNSKRLSIDEVHEASLDHVMKILA